MVEVNEETIKKLDYLRSLAVGIGKTFSLDFCRSMKSILQRVSDDCHKLLVVLHMCPRDCF